jgi:trehalose 6-phosphate synthase
MPDIDRHLDGRTLILLSNREPYEHIHKPDGIEVKQPAGGLVSALDPTMRRTSGVWVAWGSGSADRDVADEHDRVAVPPPPDGPGYTLRRVWLDEQDVEGYYLGFANSSLWPLCHLLIQHFEFRSDDWERYRTINDRFAAAVVDEARHAPHRPVVWIQDYHFALVAERLRQEIPDLFVHQFWHIPFPPPDILRLLPIGVIQTLLRGMLGNDLIEFQTERNATSFLRCVDEFLPSAIVDADTLEVHIDGRVSAVGAFPISIDADMYEGLARDGENARRAAALRDQYASGGRALGISVDRVDYTKGIPHRLAALDQLWGQYPELRERFTMLVVATPSRSELRAYSELEARVREAVSATNARYGTITWTPIVLVNENIDAPLLASIYRAADLCLVSSLQDGMNLVAKEFIACQIDERGVLVLSRFTGAAEEVEGALLINPFNPDGFVAGIRAALDMGADERRLRMRALRAQVKSATIFDWLEGILTRCDQLMAANESKRVKDRRDDDPRDGPAPSRHGVSWRRRAGGSSVEAGA